MTAINSWIDFIFDEYAFLKVILFSGNPIKDDA